MMETNYKDHEAQAQRIRGKPDDPPCPDEPLPASWRKSSDTKGEYIYYNRNTGERQYNHPNNCNKDDQSTPIPEDESVGVLTGIGQGLKKRYSSDYISRLDERMLTLESRIDSLESNGRVVAIVVEDLVENVDKLKTKTAGGGLRNTKKRGKTKKKRNTKRKKTKKRKNTKKKHNKKRN